MAQYSKIKKDLQFGLGVTALGVALGILIPFQVSGYAGADGSWVSGRTLPWMSAIVLTFLGILQTIFAWRELKTCSVDIVAHARRGISPETRRVISYALAITVYLVGMKLIGFELASFFMIIFAMIFSGCRNKLAIALAAVLTPALIYLVFVKGMYMLLPDSILRDFVYAHFF